MLRASCLVKRKDFGTKGIEKLKVVLVLVRLHVLFLSLMLMEIPYGLRLQGKKILQ